MSDPVDHSKTILDAAVGEVGKPTGSVGSNVSDPVEWPENDLSKAFRAEKEVYEQLVELIQKSVNEHKKGTTRLTKKQLSVWREQLVQQYDKVKRRRTEYVDGLPELTSKQRASSDKWDEEAQAQHMENLRFADRYAKSRSNVSSISVDSKESYISVSTRHSAAVDKVTDRLSQLEVQIQKSTSNALETFTKRFQDMLDEHATHTQAKLDRFEVLASQSMTSTLERIGKIETDTAQSLQEITDQIKEVNNVLGKSSKDTKDMASDIANQTLATKEAVETFKTEINEKLQTTHKQLAAQIDGVRQFTSKTANELKDVQDAVAEHEQEFQMMVNAKATGTHPTSSHVTSTPAVKPKSAMSTILHRRTLMGLLTNTTSDQTSTSTSGVQPDRTHVIASSPSTTTNMDQDPTFNTYVASSGTNPGHSGGCCGRLRKPTFTIQPFDGQPKNYARFKAKFMTLYHSEFEDDAGRLCMLEELLSERVRNEIGECLTDSKMYSVVWDRLDAVYGRCDVMDQKYLDELLELPPLKTLDAGSLKTFANKLHGAVVTLSKSKFAGELNSRTTMMVLESKLPPSLREKWDLKKKKSEDVKLSVLDLDDWVSLKSLGKEENKNVFSALATSTSKGPKSDEKRTVATKKPISSATSTVYHVTTSTSGKAAASPPPATVSKKDSPKADGKEADGKHEDSKCFICTGKRHRLNSCPLFLPLSPTKRAERLFKLGRCLSCLYGRHLKKDCTREIKCNADGCSDPRHNVLLHGSEFTPPKKTADLPAPSAPPPEAFLGAATHSGKSRRRVLFKIVHVRLLAGDKWFDTFGFLDTGSDTTLIRSDIAKEKLGLVGPSKDVTVASYDGAISHVNATTVRFSIASVDGKCKFEVQRAYSIDSLKVTPNPVISERQRESWTYLGDIELPDVQLEDVTVLIGIDVAEAHDHEESIKPPAGTIGPIAFKTPFGWCLGGQTGPPSAGSPFVAHIVTEEKSDDLSELVKKFWQLEAKDVYVDQSVLSEEDLRGQQILESSIVNVGNRYQVNLMWKTDDVELPCNRQAALKRLYALEKRFARDAEFARKYDAVIQEYINLGHARLLTAEEAKMKTCRTWYPSHHGVVNESSSTTKVRVVFDAAAEFEGTSLNKELLRGPNLLVSLLGVLLRFRRNLIPVGADIEKMFHQVRVPEEDQAASVLSTGLLAAAHHR